ncbi:Htaa domain protein [Streptomyces sp. A7024]|uniref:Htaa domain protein n=1 Tax=Streptomyces coryli TaxID=1128680 RepID=A0A6G4TXT9_9ACTN|nr:HtaA domain-containing protein [Streptomyces coryli]NGN64266.1 Htaa domain protein [Streptomyces coryli]
MPRRSLPAYLATALAALLFAGLLPKSTAHAEARTVSGGRLDWGIKSSFLAYVTGPIAQGKWTLLDNAASGFRFHSATGSYDPGTGALTAAFTGGVHFTGHKEGGSYRLDMTLRRFTVKIAGGKGTLHADVTSKDRDSGQVSSQSQVALANLGVSGVNMRGGGTPIALNRVPATLTAAGEKAFGGYYPAGTALDPVSLSVDVKAAAKKPKSPSAKPSSSSDDKDDKPAADGKLRDGAVDWGVRRTFREYVTGPVAKGKWAVSNGAKDGGALFRFGAGTGTYDAKKQRLDADFSGKLRFTGKDLDLVLSGVGVEVAKGKGTLSADVTSAGGKTDQGVPLVTFDAGELKPKDGLVAVADAKTRLTKDGSKAFGGMYPAGTEMDPVSVAAALDKDAELPALPDLGSDAAPSAAAETKAAVAAETEPAGSSGSNALPLSLGGAALLLAAAGAGAYAVRRRKAAAGGASETSTPTD